jgi:hypothetical protein
MEHSSPIRPSVSYATSDWKEMRDLLKGLMMYISFVFQGVIPSPGLA